MLVILAGAILPLPLEGAHPIIYQMPMASNTNALVDNATYTHSLLKVGHYHERYGAPNDIEVRGDLAFVSSNWGGLLIFNISNPEQPTLLSTFNEERTITKKQQWSEGSTFCVEVEEDLALISDGSNGLLIINVSNPAEPRLQGKYPHKNIGGLHVKGKLAFQICNGRNQANYGNILQIIDFSNASQPQLLAEIDQSLSGGYFREPFLDENNLLYVMSNPYLVIINISTPTQPVEILRLNVDGGINIRKVREHLLISYSNSLTRLNSLKIVNITYPINSFIIKEIPIELEWISDIETTNNTAFLSDFYNQLIIGINITDIENPQQIFSISNYYYVGSSTKQIALREQQEKKLLFCADYNYGVYSFDVTNITNPKLLGRFDTNGLAWRLDIEGDYAYVCTRREAPYYPARLEIISIANITKPTLVGSFEVAYDTIMDVDAAGGYAYLSLAGSGLMILDVRNPAQPVLVGSYKHPSIPGIWQGAFGRLWFDGETKLSFLTHEGHDLVIVNCTDPTAPTLVTTFRVYEPFEASSLYLKNSILYLTSNDILGGYLAVIDVSTPQKLLLLYKEYMGGEIVDIALQGKRAYLAGKSAHTVVVDVSDASPPRLLGELRNWWLGFWEYTKAIAIEGRYAYVAQYTAGLRVVDISRPAALREVAAMRDHYRGVCYDVFVRDGYIFVADGWDGLEIYELKEIPTSIPPQLLLAIIIPVAGSIIVMTIVILSLKKKLEV